MIRADILKKSIDVAQKVLEISPNLKGVGAKVDYFDRVDYFQNLLGENGYVSFHPEVTFNILETFLDILERETRLLRDKFFRSKLDTEEYYTAQFKVYLSEYLQCGLTPDDLLNNTVPERAKNYIEQPCDSYYSNQIITKIAKGFKSPKLSKVLVKLFGEQSETVKWYTCKCPKKLETGILENWTITLSILPHHIAGMSYYSSYNHGGDRWREGYEGTSCMDTKRNGLGNGVFHLIPSLRDITMAVAYLSRSEDDDIWNPIYQARCLVRVVEINGQHHMLVCRPYFVSNEATHILVDGLKHKFGNVHFLRDIRNSEHANSDMVNFVTEFPRPIRYEVDHRIVCEECDGAGHFGYDEYGNQEICEACSGEGEWHVSGEFLPYIDDSDFICVKNDKIIFSLPKSYLQSVGVEIVEDAPICAVG